MINALRTYEFPTTERAGEFLEGVQGSAVLRHRAVEVQDAEQPADELDALANSLGGRVVPS